MNKDQLDAIKALVESNFTTSDIAIMANTRQLLISLIAEIESLKAITELAVKGLKKVLCVRHDGLVSSEIFTGEVGAGQEKCQEIAQSALDQIERLSHE